MIEKKELPKIFNPQKVENILYKKWENGKYFKPRPGKTKKSFSIVMPLPNVTGRLHLGHALDATTQDTLTRYKRMKGYEAVWLPATDHAGIATQSVVEKIIYEKEGKTKHDFTKEEFIKKIWEWKKEYGGIIEHQQRTLGAGPDWDYAMFTLDPEANEAVNKAFVKLYNDGLIYQADYIINWDPQLQSAISDAEVDHKEIKGTFYHILYQIEGSDKTLEIATTRPETMLGDTAVAVNPNDNRFNHLIGKNAIIPICNRTIPIIGDEYVDMKLGTGCLKVTPGHDFNDFEIGRRHNLQNINILNKNGTLNELGLEYKNLSCEDAREKIVEKLKTLNILPKMKDHIHQVGHGERSGAIIEPIVSKQWFVNVQEMAKVAVTKVEDNSTKFYPKSWENTYYAWLKKPKNWCISRQLWWGHPIPVFYCNDCNNQWASEVIPTECIKCSSKKISQDPDVLDTWFSSGLWPMTILGWPNEQRMKERKFDTFFPTTTLVTGFDIIFFWVARMMMMSLKIVEKIPFDSVYIHAIVRDKYGRKMSKSLNNGIDPIDVVNEYGADALRFTLTSSSGYNRTINLDPARIEGYRNFINKLWNAFRFVNPFLTFAKDELPPNEQLTHHDRWILSELNEVAKKMSDHLDEFRFDEASNAIYSFVYDKFCSWYIELSKKLLYSDNDQDKINRATILKFAFKNIIALLHPITPYVTEEIWSYLKTENEDLLIVHDYPEYSANLVFEVDRELMNKFVETITTIRNLRASVNIKPKDEISVSIYLKDESLIKYFIENTNSFSELARINELKVLKSSEPNPTNAIMQATTTGEIYLLITQNINLKDQIIRLKKSLEKVNVEYSKYDKKLSNSKFMTNAPDEIKIDVKTKADELYNKKKSLEKNIYDFEKIN